MRLTSRRGQRTRGFRLEVPTRLSGQTGKLTVEHTWDLLPYSQRIRGVNLAENGENFSASSTAPAPWAKLWTLWNTTGIQRELDEAVALGCNTVRMAGSVLAVTGGHITRSQYLAKWTQLSGWCQSRGLFLYPYLADYYNEGSALSNTTTLTNEIVAAAAHLHTLPDIIGLDLVQECDPWIGGTSSPFTPNGPGAAASLALYQAVKAVTNLPCTFSRTTSPNPGMYLWDDRSDFSDCHIYGSSSAGDFTTAWANTSWGGYLRPIVFGEFGVYPNTGDAADITRINEVNAVLAATGTYGQRLAGALRWSVEDYDSGNAGNRLGLFDLNGAEKSAQTAPFRTITKTY